MRILYIHATFTPPPVDIQADRFFLLSRRLEGEILQPLWYDSAAKVEARFGPGSYPTRQCGKFRYHWFLGWKYTGVRRKVELLRFYFSKALELHRERPIDCIVVYSHQLSGVAASLVKLLTGSKLVVEIATSPELVHLTDRPSPVLFDRVKHFYSDLCLHISSRSSDRLHLLSPGQMAAYPSLKSVPASVFHEFVPVSAIQRSNTPQQRQYILLVGAPWYLKGADLLVQAFQRLEADFPSVDLKMLGHYPELAGNPAAAGSGRIQVIKAVPYPEALALISGAAVLVLPSRCEGMGRVLIEAMAAGIPVIGSDVGGIPHMIRDGQNGFLFPRGNARELEDRLRRVLSDPELAAKLGAEGLRLAHSEFDDDAWVDGFADMVEAAVRGPSPGTAH